MKNFIQKLFHKGNYHSQGQISEKGVEQLNPNRRFIIEKGDDGYKNTTYIAIRDRHHPSYKSNRNDVMYEDKDVLYYAKSVYNGSYTYSNYYTPAENLQRAIEIEMHLDSLEKLGILSHFVLVKS